jgi:hypothetical protein
MRKHPILFPIPAANFDGGRCGDPIRRRGGGDEATALSVAATVTALSSEPSD